MGTGFLYRISALAVIIHGDRADEVIVPATDITAVIEIRTLGVHLGHEGVVEAVERLVRPLLDGKARLTGFDVPGDIGPSLCVNCDAISPVDVVPADVAAVFEIRAPGVHLGHEGVDAAVVK